MLFRKLGRTGLDVGIIGLGTEHLEYEPYEVIKPIVDEAMDHGANYIDLFMASPGVRDNFGAALKGKRHNAVIAGHLGAAQKDGQYFRTRDKDICEKYFNDLLARLNTDYIDILMLHFIDEADDYQFATGGSGFLETALKFKREGKARYIGLSSHKVPVALAAVESSLIDVLMFPVNPAFDILPGETELEALWKADPYQAMEMEDCRPSVGRKELFLTCEKLGVGIVAMKTYAGGWIFWENNPSSIVLTPAQCIHYSLSQPGVCTVVPGCKTLDHMKSALRYLDASEEEKDYTGKISKTKWNLKGNCMYCNHCLPCPQGINIAAVTRLLDAARSGLSDSLRSGYEKLGCKASDCVRCGVCMERCPFGVDILENMERAANIFER